MIHLNIKTIFLLSKDEIPIAYYFSALDSKNSQNYDYYYLTIDENPTISKANDILDSLNDFDGEKKVIKPEGNNYDIFLTYLVKAKKTGFFQKKPDIQEDMTFKIG